MNLVKNTKIDCSLYVDQDENAVRWGFGQHEALKKIKDNLDLLNVQTAERIRLSVVVVDDLALVFSPVAFAWEEELKKVSYPNGIICGATVAKSFIEQLQSNQNDLQEISKIIPFPGCTIPKRTKENVRNDLQKVDDRLTELPAVDPAKLRKITIYRNNYKVLKIEIRGINIKKKSITLQPVNVLLPNVSGRLRASWQVFSKDELEGFAHYKKFRKEIEKIIEEYALDIKRFGYLIKTEDQKELKSKVEREVKDFVAFLKAKTNDDLMALKSKYVPKIVDQQSHQQTFFPAIAENDEANQQGPPNLGIFIEKSKKALVNYYLELISGNNKAEGAILLINGALNRMVQSGEIEKSNALKLIVEDLIENKLKFPEAEKFAGSVDVIVDPYDVSDELLYENDDFRKCMKEIEKSNDPENKIKLRKFSDAFESSLID